MQSKTLNRLQKVEGKLSRLDEVDGTVIYDAETRELLSYHPGIFDLPPCNDDGFFMEIPHNHRDDLSESPLGRKAKADQARRRALGLPPATIELFREKLETLEARNNER